MYMHGGGIDSVFLGSRRINWGMSDSRMLLIGYMRGAICLSWMRWSDLSILLNYQLHYCVLFAFVYWSYLLFWIVLSGY
jgi:hypothetical protein